MPYFEKIGDSIKNSEFRQELEELIYVAEKLRWQSIRIFIAILIAIFSFAFFTFAHSYFNRQIIELENRGYSSSYTVSAIEKYQVYDVFFCTLTLLILITGLFFLYQFSKTKKKGIIIYDELTDELDWGQKRKEYIERPSIETRIIIKDFLQNTDLPFTSGSNGQTVYLVFFFLLLISSIIVKAI